MYNVDLIKTGFDGLVGIRQNVDPLGVQLTDLITSSSGLWIDGAHPLLTIDNLESIAPQFDLIDPAQAAINIAFTSWLKAKFEDSTIKAIQDWLSKKSNLGTANNLLANPKLYSTTGSVLNTITNTSKVVGFEFIPIREKSISVTINEIGLQLSANQTLNVKLFEAELTAPVQTASIIYTGGGGSVQWETVNWVLNGEKSYWIVYDQADLTGTAINGIYDHTAQSRGTAKQPNEKYFSATPFNVEAANTTSIWDIRDNVFTSSSNYGLNFKITAECDYTQFIIEQKDLFKEIAWLRIGMDLLREMAFNPSSRVNRNESNIDRSQLIYEIDGDSQGRTRFSLNGRYESALSSIQFDSTGIEKTCLPCRRRGIRIKSLG
jgi:hypothetical protein